MGTRGVRTPISTRGFINTIPHINQKTKKVNDLLGAFSRAFTLCVPTRGREVSICIGIRLMRVCVRCIYESLCEYLCAVSGDGEDWIACW